MPELSQGDIFEAAARSDVAIVFGHLGFNEMQLRWTTFSAQHAALAQVRDPFDELAGGAIEWTPGRWIWFVAEQENHGMTDAQLRDALNTALSWASARSLKSIATNGIMNTDHGRDSAINRQSDSARAAMLVRYAEQAEREHQVAINLVSLNDVFVRF